MQGSRRGNLVIRWIKRTYLTALVPTNVILVEVVSHFAVQNFLLGLPREQLPIPFTLVTTHALAELDLPQLLGACDLGNAWEILYSSEPADILLVGVFILVSLLADHLDVILYYLELR